MKTVIYLMIGVSIGSLAIAQCQEPPQHKTHEAAELPPYPQMKICDEFGAPAYMARRWEKMARGTYCE